MIKNLPAMQGTWVWSLSWEDPLEKGMATHSSILACRIPWIEEPGGIQSMASQRVRHDWVTNSQYLSLTLRISGLEKVAICMFLFPFRWQNALFFWPPPPRPPPSSWVAKMLYPMAKDNRQTLKGLQIAKTVLKKKKLEDILPDFKTYFRNYSN